MEIVENKALILRTRNPQKYECIPNSANLGLAPDGVYEVAVHWELDAVRVLRNLGVKNAPSPIEGHYTWPGRHKPFSHQRETSAFLTLYNRAFVFSEPGTGKTMSAIWAADFLMNIGRVRKALVLCPLSIMQSAWHKDIASSAIHRSAVVAHHVEAERRIRMVNHGYDFTIVNYDGLPMIADALKKRGDVDLVIVDECFVAGTRIATPLGERPIESITPGTQILTSNGVSRTKRLVRKTTRELVTLQLSNGRTIKCTPEHPIFTDAGWVVAEETVGRRLVHAVELPDVRKHLPFSDVEMGVVEGERYGYWADLQQILRAEAVPCAEPWSESFQRNARAPARALDGGAPHCGTTGPHVARHEGEEVRRPRRKRSRHDGVRALGFHGASDLVYMELPSSVGDEAARLSDELQARLRMAGPEARVGGGRTFAQLAEATFAGCEERSEAGGAWVVRVSHHEYAREVPVFNLEVEGTPHYIAEGCVVHNCNAYKNPQTKRWKVLNSLLAPDTMLWMMTGTPAAQSPIDAFGLAKLVNPAGVPRFQTAWKDEVMTQITRFKWVAKASSRERVHTALQPAIRFTKKECLDLPPVLTATREVPLTPQQAKYYKIIKTQMLSNVAGETISAVNAAAVVNKLLQISAGAAYTDNHEVVEFDCGPRLQALMEVIDETPNKAIVFAHYRHSIDTIYQHVAQLGVPCEIIHGGVSPTRRSEIFHNFQTKPDPRVLVIQDQAASHGVTLTAADTVIFWGPVMSVETYLQCIARTDRIGQSSDKVTVVHIQGSDIERKMFKQLESRVADHDLFVKLYEEISAEGVAQP